MSLANDPVIKAVYDNILGNLPKKPKAVPMSCNECSLEFSSQIVLDTHLTGSKHQRKVKAKELLISLEKTEPGFERDSISGVIRCITCDITVNSPQLLATHLAGNKHKSRKHKRLEKDQEGPPLKKLNANTDSKDPKASTDSNVPKVKTDRPTIDIPLCVTKQENEGSKQGPTYKCNPCQAHCNSDVQLTQHLGSKKHLDKVSQKRNVVTRGRENFKGDFGRGRGSFGRGRWGVSNRGTPNREYSQWSRNGPKRSNNYGGSFSDGPNWSSEGENHWSNEGENQWSNEGENQWSNEGENQWSNEGENQNWSNEGGNRNWTIKINEHSFSNNYEDQNWSTNGEPNDRPQLGDNQNRFNQSPFDVSNSVRGSFGRGRESRRSLFHNRQSAPPKYIPSNLLSDSLKSVTYVSFNGRGARGRSRIVIDELQWNAGAVNMDEKRYNSFEYMSMNAPPPPLNAGFVRSYTYTQPLSQNFVSGGPNPN